jgi:hypothetical protein
VWDVADHELNLLVEHTHDVVYRLATRAFEGHGTVRRAVARLREALSTDLEVSDDELPCLVFVAQALNVAVCTLDSVISYGRFGTPVLDAVVRDLLAKLEEFETYLDVEGTRAEEVGNLERAAVLLLWKDLACDLRLELEQRWALVAGRPPGTGLPTTSATHCPPKVPRPPLASSPLAAHAPPSSTAAPLSVDGLALAA